MQQNELFNDLENLDHLEKKIATGERETLTKKSKKGKKKISKKSLAEPLTKIPVQNPDPAVLKKLKNKPAVDEWDQAVQNDRTPGQNPAKDPQSLNEQIALSKTPGQQKT